MAQIDPLPLYTKLVSETSTWKQPRNPNLFTIIQDLPDPHPELISAIILLYTTYSHNNTPTPYNVEIPPGGTGGIFKIDNLPVPLQCIICRYLEILTDANDS